MEKHDEQNNALRAQQLSRKWGERLDEFHLPCPLCKGELQFQGARPDHFYEFADAEPGVVYPLDALTLSFICNRCGYAAEFDAELFNPGYIAQLQGAPQEKVSNLSIRDYSVLVSLMGSEKTTTLLDLATAIAGAQHGEVIVFNTVMDTAKAELLQEKLQRYVPERGDPAPVQLIQRTSEDFGKELLDISIKRQCDLLMLDGRDWANKRPVITETVNKVLATSRCDVAIVYDRGWRDVRRILLATSGGSNARAAASVSIALARALEAQLHLLYVASPNHPNWREEGQKAIADTLREVNTSGIHIEKHIEHNPDMIEYIVKEAANYDLLLIGASTPNLRRKEDSLAAKIARNVGSTSIMVHGHQSLIQAWLKRFLG